ncbi:LIM domain-binding protein 3 [Sarracenia purpurea var. burkii]
MAQLLTLRLTRNDSSTSWGFRLQGGKDFGTPLLIQKVNVGSLAERAGLQVGDAVIRVNGKEVADVRHKDAQDVIVRAGNVVEFQIQRGGTATWKPSVTPVGSVPSPNPFISTSPSPITKTSLAASPHQSPRIPQGFNSSSKPFSPQQTNGGYVNENGSIKAIVNKQYNTPVGIYSDESIAETLSAQAEVLAGGVLGDVDFDGVYAGHAVGGQATSSRPQTPIADLLNRPRSATSSPIPPAPKASSDPDSLSCSECRQNIVGVFVRIKEKNLHVECFKCATCGTSLKNVGYYSINNKLYCDIHAKMVARQNPPAPNLEPITVSPSQHGASKIISTALIANSNSATLSPQPTLAPVPFHPPRQSPTHVSSPVPHSQMPDYYHPRIASPLPIYSKPHQQSDVEVNEPFSRNEMEKSSISSPLPIYPNPKPRQQPDVEVSKPFGGYEKLEESDDDVQTCVIDQICEIMVPESGSKCIIEQTRKTLNITCMSPVPATQPSKHEFEPVQEDNVTLESLPRPVTPSGYIASLLTTASDRPFTPIEPAKATIFTEPVPLPPETIPYFPTSKEENHGLSDMQRPATAAEEEPKRPSLANALTVAPKRSYTPLSRGITEQIKEEETDIKVPDLTEDPSIILTRPSFDIMKSEKDAKKSTATKSICLGSALAPSPFHVTEAAFPPICDELKAKFEKRLRTGSISDKNVPKNVSGESVKEASVEKRPARSPFTPTGLYKPINLPHYQQCVKELTSRNKTPLSRRNTPTPKGPESRKNTPTPKSELSQNLPSGTGGWVVENICVIVPYSDQGYNREDSSVLGYQPGSIVENMSSYTKVEKCVRTVCDKTLKQILSTGLSVQSCTSQSNELQVTKTNTSRCSSPINTPSVSISAAKEDIAAVKPPRSSTPIKKTSRPSTPVSQSNQHQPLFHPSIQTPQHKQTTFSPQQHVYTSTEASQQQSTKPSSYSHPSTQISRPKTTALPQQHVITSTEVSQQQSTKPSSYSHPLTQISQPKTTSLPQQHVITSTEVSQQKSNTTSVHSHPSTQISQPKTTSLPQQHVFTSTEASQQQSNTTASSSQQRLYSSSSQTKSMAALNISHNLSKTLTAIASKHQSFNTSSKNLTTSTITSSDPNLTGSNVGVGSRAGTSAGLSAPRRGRGVWNPQNSTPGARIPLCAQCSSQIRYIGVCFKTL